MQKHTLIAFFIIAVTGGIWLRQYASQIVQQTDVTQAEYIYSQSQYVKGDAAPLEMSDAQLYTYTAARYVQGEDPTQINFEHPPFGKYVLGLSWKLFGNMTVINFGLYLFSLSLLWQLSELIIKHANWRLAALIGICSLQLIPHYAFQSMLDMQLLFYVLLFFYSLFKIKTLTYQTLLTGFALGAYANTKYFFPSFFLLVGIVGLVMIHRKQLKQLVMILAAATGIYLLSYWRYFLVHPNPVDFLKFEWYRFRWWTGERTMPRFLLLSTLFTGEFKGWWGENVYEQAATWSLTWPASFMGWLLSLPFIPRRITPTTIINLYVVGQFALFLLGAAANERYLVQLLPFWVLMLAYGAERVFKNRSKYKKLDQNTSK